MSMVKLTFSMDEGTVRTLKATAERLRKPQSLVVREAVAEYAARAGQLTAIERRHLLKQLHDLSRRPPTRPQAQADAEVRGIRRARRAVGRRHRAE